MIGLAFLALLAATRSSCTAGGEFEPPLCPTGLAEVSAIRIEAQGITLWQEPDPAPPCRSFRPTAPQIKRFFGAARSADPRAVHFTLPESPCAAEGSVRFSDGSRGRWQVDGYALGWLDRPGHPRMTLYCRRCRNAPWMQ